MTPQNHVLTLLAALALSGCATPTAPVVAKPNPVAQVKPSQVIPIMQIDRGVLIVMPVEKVSFETGKATVTAVEAHEFLDRVAAILKDKTSANIELEGHTDSTGNRALNQKLSEDRAATIRQELGWRGIASKRMTTAGFAFDRPVASNDSEDGRSENRRVELVIVGEELANITRGEPAGSFEQAFGNLKARIDKGGLMPSKGS